MLFLYIIGALICVSICAALINTAITVRKARKLSGQHPSFTDEELVPYGKALQEMIRCKTISVKDSYDDTEFAKLREGVR